VHLIVALALVFALGPQAQTAAAFKPAASAASGSDVIAPQDLLKIAVVGEADLTLQVRVAADGMIPFPYITMIKAGGLTLEQLQAKLAAALADGWIKNPVVRVEFDRVNVKNVIVHGMVRAPGRFQFTGTRTLLEVLADAGLQMAQAGNGVTITRLKHPDNAAGETERAATATLTVNLADSARAQAFLVQDGDVIEVPEIQTFYVSGEVRNQGNYVWQPHMTLGEAVTLAGGLSERGTFRGASAMRTIEGKQSLVKLSTTDMIQPDDRITIGHRLF